MCLLSHKFIDYLLLYRLLFNAISNINEFGLFQKCTDSLFFSSNIILNCKKQKQREVKDTILIVEIKVTFPGESKCKLIRRIDRRDSLGIYF